MKNLVTFLYGCLITLLGIIGYFATGQVSKTALIPCVFGFPIIALSILAWYRSNLTYKTSVAAGFIALLAFGGTAGSLGKAISLIYKTEIDRPAAITVQGIMAIASLVYCTYIAVIILKSSNHNI